MGYRQQSEDREDEGAPRPGHEVARFSFACLAVQGVLCRLCAEACRPGAIGFLQAVGGYALPEVDATRCTGCGDCVGACPQGVIEIG